MPTTQRFLVPLDFSKTSLPAIRTARRLATASTEIHLLHSYSTYLSVMPHPCLFMPHPTVFTLEVEKALWRRMEHLRQSELGNVASVSWTVVFDPSPVSAICDLARKKRIDLIIMAARERNGLFDLFRRSLADRVAGAAPCPVMVVRPESDAAGEGSPSFSLVARAT